MKHIQIRNNLLGTKLIFLDHDQQSP